MWWRKKKKERTLLSIWEEKLELMYRGTEDKPEILWGESNSGLRELKCEINHYQLVDLEINTC